ncbi:hypothetical protein [Dinghuibacter silviterrae]|uniref:PepSY-like beta-lactamase-inhibitor n=1 Tax=Dinghuibacter silviterrae TaxID=1539049 RepID=A0A4R8DHN0_9BACT|nr:hypothetical protein [Dinghuibacter silviterrae]TDW97231.1 hypothetical protein EDB95_5077 [Dinghuibacter silviterrae]
MKKFAAIAAIVLTAAQPVFAGNNTGTLEGENTRAMKSFNASYKGASAIWNEEKNYTEVLFFWNGHMMDSFYDVDGNLIGTFHTVAASTLPAKVREHIASWYKGYEIKEVTVMQKDGEDDMTYVKVVSPKHIRVLEVKADGDINEFEALR